MAVRRSHHGGWKAELTWALQ